MTMFPGIGGARLAAAVIFTAAAAGPLSANDLEMYIENQSSETLYYETQVGVAEYPTEIPANTTSGEIKSTEKGGGGDGQITYINNQNPAAATCKVTLAYGFKLNPVTSHCDNKKFNPNVTGACTLVQAGDRFDRRHECRRLLKRGPNWR